MTKELLIQELKQRGIEFTKIIFHKESPYQKKRYKQEFIEWEAWLYNGKSKVGFLLTQSEFEDKAYLKDKLEAFTY